ncbi:hypothetical protein [Devosia sp.]|uniref:hypothetical protein n=1 Tax=Devosia sp. TaxID=1871048 RepID=UPI003BAC442F
MAIYPETYSSNMLGARHVVRYLLNRPGIASSLVSDSYGPNDFFLHFDESHVPERRRSRDMFLPVVDRATYHPPAAGTTRNGFVICSRRKPDKPLVLPQWMTPLSLVVPHRPKTHEELAELYRASRALIAFDRTSAIYEALCCGCPIVALSTDSFNQKTYQPRFGGAGMTWTQDEAGLALASADVQRFIDVYHRIESDLPDKISRTFTDILAECAARNRSTDFTPRTA